MSYNGLTKRKRNLLTKGFLQTFKEELIKVYQPHYPNIDFENATYYSFYGQEEGTRGFYTALKNACKKHNLIKAIYEYANRMPWYDSDCFESDLVTEMIKQGIIEEGKIEYDEEMDESKYLTNKYKEVTYCNGYNVVKYGYWYDNKKDLEDTYNKYKKDNEELIWLN
jgi:hypothetical protein